MRGYFSVQRARVARSITPATRGRIDPRAQLSQVRSRFSIFIFSPGAESTASTRLSVPYLLIKRY